MINENPGSGEVDVIRFGVLSQTTRHRARPRRRRYVQFRRAERERTDR